MKFLVVDDSPTMRRIIRNALGELGYDDMAEAEDGSKALQVLEEEAIDFIITDWNMPNTNGLQLTKAVRSHSEYGRLPILMITTRGMKEDVITAMKARVSSYVIKPFTPDVLEEKINLSLQTA